MIDRDLLIDMGFAMQHGWDHEVWYWDGDFWVHFGGKEEDHSCSIRGDLATRKEFFDKFIEHVQESEHDGGCL